MSRHKSPKFSLIRTGSWADQFLDRHFSSTYFSYRNIFSMFLPLVLDQFFISIIGLLTTAMISSSSQESVSAVSLVTPLYLMIYAIFSAISAGGTVVIAQYKGRGDKEKIRKAAGQIMLATSVFAIVSCVALVISADSLVKMLYGSASPLVLIKSRNYLIGVAVSFIFLSFYMGAYAIFRGIGETKICLHLSMIINLIHLFASLLFINGFHLDILGTILSLNLARLVGSVIAVRFLISSKSVLRVYIKDIFCIDWPILKSIFRISAPFALEQLFFNGGGMLVQTYIVTLGTISVAANALANSAFSIIYAAGVAVGTLSITVVGRCIGADDKKMARKYGNSMVLLGTGLILLSIVVFFPLMPVILKLYGAPANTISLIYSLLLIAIIPLPFFWVTSNVIPSVLKSAGDVIFSSVVSLITMWAVRVALGYVFAISLGLGIQGVWICMGLEWVVRTIIYYIRYRSDTWLGKKAIE